MSRRRKEILRCAVPPVVTVVLVLAYFAIFNRWNKLDDPINSIAVLVIAIAVCAVAAAIDIDRMHQTRSSGTAPEHH